MEVFTTLFLLGLFLCVIMIFMSFLGDFDVLGGDMDVDLDGDFDMDADMDFDTDIDGTDHNVGFSFFSPFVISFLLMGIGMGGTVLDESYDLESPVLFGGALIIGVCLMVAVQKMLRAYFVNSQVNSLVRNRDFKGAIGVVTLRIPESDIGEVAVSTKMGRIKMAARADMFLPEGTKVIIKEKLGNNLIVKPADPTKVDKPSGEKNEVEMKESSVDESKQTKEDEESEFTFEAYRKKEEAKKPTVIYDQRNITINDSVISRSDFSEMGATSDEKPLPSEMKKKMKKEIANEIIKDEK